MWLFILSSFLLVLKSNAECTLECTTLPCYADVAAAMDCLNSIPYNETWVNATIDVISQSLENFGFDALYHSTGPPYVVSMDIQQELADLRDQVYANDLEFQEKIQSIFQRTFDAHTRYQKPYCYNVIFVQPFAFDFNADGDTGANIEPKVFMMKNIYTDEYNTRFPGLNINALIGKQIVLVNGLEVTTAVSAWGDQAEVKSNNRGIRFNAALRSYLYRSAIAGTVKSIEDLVVTFSDNTVVTLPWLASYGLRFADVSYCEAQPATRRLEDSGGNPTRHRAKSEVFGEPVPMVHEVLTQSREDRLEIVSVDNFRITCFVQSVTANSASKKAGVSRVLVMRVSSFSPPGEWHTAWAGFLNDAATCLSAEYDMVVVDVIQNGGGYVCLGLRLIELLVEDYFNDHTQVQMIYDLPHSKLMDNYIDVVNSPEPFPDPGEVEYIIDRNTQESFKDGKDYYYPGRTVIQGGVESKRTNIFSLDCRDAEILPTGFVPPRFMSPDKLIILTDGTCGSTCASFTKIPQEAGKATFIGVGGIMGDSMDVSSYAGGFVCNPNLLLNMSIEANSTFPQFVTQQNWQFGWATWYSAKLPSRQTQFTQQEPDYREEFWGFPHASIDPAVTSAMISTLYDRVIASSIDRLAAANEETDCPSHLLSNPVSTIVLIGCAVFFLGFVVMAYMYWKLRSNKYSALDVEKGYIIDSPFLR